MSERRRISRDPHIFDAHWPWTLRKRRPHEYGTHLKIEGPHGITLDCMDGTNYQMNELVKVLNAVERETRLPE
jgi:hypothetical protein